MIPRHKNPEYTPNARELSQAAYVDQIIADYGIHSMRTFNKPMDASFYSDYESLKDEAITLYEQYRSIIGALMFLSTRK